MALFQPVSLPLASFTALPPRNCILIGSSSAGLLPHRVRKQCIVASTATADQTIVRKSANYQPSIWGDDFIQSLTNKFAGKSCEEQVSKLKEDVRLMLDKVVDPLNGLELIDSLQRLGLSYHFEEEIKGILNRIYNNNLSNRGRKQGSLYAIALEFRLLRQHGYDISTEIFNSFRDDNGHFRLSLGGDGDCKGILYLYEAAYLLKEGEESIFYEARNFTATYLKKHGKDIEDQYLSTLVTHALELPLHWRMPRWETSWFIDVFQRKHDCDPTLLEFAKLDFDVVQSTHQEDLKYTSSWWRNTELGEELSFARDRLMETFLWTIGVKFEPQFGYFRRVSTMAYALIAVMDDIYDAYGTYDELMLFTDAIERWDLSAVEQLPHYMKVYFLALYNSMNEVAFKSLKEHGVNIIPDIKKEWVDLCKSFMVETNWVYNKQIPTFEDYVENGWISIATSVALQNAYFAIINPLTKEALEAFQGEYKEIIRWSGIIFRLSDDLGTSPDEMERGDVSKSIQCYMHESGCSEEEAREHIREIIAVTWMKINKFKLENPHLSNAFIEAAINLARMSQFMYQFGDGQSSQDDLSKDRVLSLVINPVS